MEGRGGKLRGESAQSFSLLNVRESAGAFVARPGVVDADDVFKQRVRGDEDVFRSR